MKERLAFPFLIAVTAIFSVAFISNTTARGEFQESSSIHIQQDQEFRNNSFNFTPAPNLEAPANSGTPAVTGPNLLKEVMGFAPYWNLSTVKNYDFTYVSIVAYFGVDIDGNSGGLITSNSGWSGWASTDRATLVANAHAKGAKVVLTVKLFDTLNSGGTQTLGGFLADTGRQSTAITQIVSEVVAKGVDGVNVDFEPIDSSSATSAQKTAFATFLTNLSNSLRSQVPGAYVSVDTYACSARGASPCSTNSFFDPAALAATPIDTMMVMAYDFYSPNSSIIAPTSPLNGFGSTYWYDVTTAVNDYLIRAPADKILLGVPYYGVKLSTSSSAPNASSLGNGANPSYAQTMTDLSCTGATRDWDGVGKVARILWFSDASKSSCGTVYNQWRQVYFDDATALGMKYDLVNAKGLRGVGIWALGYDGANYSDLVLPIQDRFSTIFRAHYDLNKVPQQVFASQSLSVNLNVTNVSPLTWASGGSNPFHLAYHWYDSSGRVAVWDGNRATLSADLAPGATATLTDTVVVPSIPGNYTLRWEMVQELVSWFSWRGDQPMDLSVTVSPSAYNVRFDASVIPTTMKTSQVVKVPVTVTDIGLPWTIASPNGVAVSYHWLNTNGSVVTWDGERTSVGVDSDYGDQRQVTASIITPPTPGTYILRIDLIKELVTWFSWQGAQTYDVLVKVVGSDSSSFRAVFSENSTPYYLTSGQSTNVDVKVTNNGTANWNSGGSNPVRLSYHLYDSSGRIISWDNQRTALAADLPSGASVMVTAGLTAPTSPGVYYISWDMVKEQVTWFNWTGSDVLVGKILVLPEYGQSFQVSYTPSTMPVALSQTVQVKIKNSGSSVWNTTGSNITYLGYHWLNSSGQVVDWNGVWTPFAADVNSLETVTLNATVTTPSIPGIYTLQFDLVKNGITWFSWRGAPTQNTVIRIR